MLDGTGGPHAGSIGVAFDAYAPLRDCLQLYHDAAIETGGVFVLTTIDKTGKVRPQQFTIGDVDGMAAEALARCQVANVYFAPATLRSDLPRDVRGTTNDIVAVLGLVVDDDGDTGKRAVLPPSINPTIEVTTSTQPVVNRHYHFVFTRALSPREAKSLAALLHRKCGGDHGTKDIAHVWRLPQTRNHPNAAKLARGRQAEAQPVEVTGGTFERVDPDELRPVLEALPDLYPPRRTNGTENGHACSGGSTNVGEIMARLPGWLADLVETEVVEGDGDRSSHCFHTTQVLMEYGLTDDEIRLLAETGAFANKYLARSDLDAEVARARAKWSGEVNTQANGQAQHDAGGAEDDEEPLPLYRSLPAADPYPIEALGALEGPARALQAQTQAPIDIAANSVLATGSLACQPHADIDLPTGEAKPLSLYIVTVASSGERKTSNDARACSGERARGGASSML